MAGRWRAVFWTIGAWSAAIACVPVLNALGSLLAGWLGLPPGGTARLGWDLAWWLLAIAVAVATVARQARGARRAQALALAILLLAVTGWSVMQLGDDFPRWFRAAALLGTPLAAWAGARVGGASLNRSAPS